MIEVSTSEELVVSVKIEPVDDLSEGFVRRRFRLFPSVLLRLVDPSLTVLRGGVDDEAAAT